jgi:hypothetical protein
VWQLTFSVWNAFSAIENAYKEIVAVFESLPKEEDDGEDEAASQPHQRPLRSGQDQGDVVAARRRSNFSPPSANCLACL